VTVIAIKLQLFNSTVKPNQLMRTEALNKWTSSMRLE
jgi:hypothetical protein